MSTRYTVLGTLASGGMGTVYLARMAGSAGFSKLVAIKRLHPELAAQKEFIAMLVDEARLASALQHANIVDTLDLVATDGAFSLVLEYVEGAALSVLLAQAKKDNEEIPRPILLSLIQGMLRGLDAAHDARGSEGQPLGIVHRDISPQNVLVGTDGVPRIIDFGIAKAMGRVMQTRPGEVRGKFSYMAPEQLLERPATRQVDVYAAGVCLWEMLTAERLFKGEDARAICAAVIRGEIPPPSSVNPNIPKELDEVVLRATARETSDRYLSCGEFLYALSTFERAPDDEVGRWVRRVAAGYIAKRAEMVQGHFAPEGSRSVEDLMQELQVSATPAEGVPIVAPPSSSLQPTRLTPVKPERPDIVIARPQPKQERTHLLAPLQTFPPPEPPPSERSGNGTATGVVMLNGVPMVGATRPWHYLVAAVSAVAVMLVGATVIMRGHAAGNGGTESQVPTHEPAVESVVVPVPAPAPAPVPAPAPTLIGASPITEPAVPDEPEDPAPAPHSTTRKPGKKPSGKKSTPAAPKPTDVP